MDFLNTNYYNNLSQDDKLLVRKVFDWIKACENKYCIKYSYFLDERKCEFVKNVLIANKYSNYVFFGGNNNSVRKILAVHSDGFEIDETAFSISSLKITYRKNDTLTHRDFLGALMSLQIKREMLGDILVFDGFCVIYVVNSHCEFIINNLRKIGSTGVTVSYNYDFNVQPIEKFNELKGTVASLRIDNLVAFVTDLNREKSLMLVKNAKVNINNVCITNPSFLIKENDVFSVRGYGKFILAKINGLTKKQRIHILVNKYI